DGPRQDLARGRPDARGLVVAGGDDAFAVGREARDLDAAGVSFERADERAGAHVEDARDAFAAGGDEAIAVGREVDRLNAAGALLERRQERPMLDVPQARRLVDAGSGERFAVGRERRAEERITVSD